MPPDAPRPATADPTRPRPADADAQSAAGPAPPPADDALPGFVDLQVNGYLGVDFTAPDLTEDAFDRACDALWATGTAAFLPTLITCPEAVARRNLTLLGRALGRPGVAARLPGIHAEGPFVSARPGAVGAHDPAAVRPPDPELLRRMQDWADGRIRLLTLAAELDGAAALARTARSLGIAVALGHQLAGPDALARLADAGAVALTHLGNGMPNTVPRHENPLFAGLGEDRLAALVVADGHHLPPAVLRTILRTKGPGRVAVTSDASPIAGCPPGRYRTLGNDAVLEPSGWLHNPAKACLVGSSATITDCMNVVAALGEHDRDALLALGRDVPLRLLELDPDAVDSAPRIVWDAAARRFAPLPTA